MIVINYKKNKHQKIITACAKALKAGKTVVYPTDTSYGLACDATNFKAVMKIYRIKQRNYQQPIHIIPTSVGYARKITFWDKVAGKLAKAFWPGPITLVLPIKSRGSFLKLLAAKTGNIGLRIPKNQIALDLVKNLNKPITNTSANPSKKTSKGYDSYSAKDVINQFKNKKYQPDIIINAGRLIKRRPSTVVKVVGGEAEILRPGPISKKQILNASKK